MLHTKIVKHGDSDSGTATGSGPAQNRSQGYVPKNIVSNINQSIQNDWTSGTTKGHSTYLPVYIPANRPTDQREAQKNPRLMEISSSPSVRRKDDRSHRSQIPVIVPKKDSTLPVRKPRDIPETQKLKQGISRTDSTIRSIRQPTKYTDTIPSKTPGHGGTMKTSAAFAQSHRPAWKKHPPQPTIVVEPTHMNDRNAPKDRKGFEIAIICALATEFNAVSLIFDKFWPDVYGRDCDDHNIYAHGPIGKFNAVLVLLPSMGTLNAASVAEGVKRSYTEIDLALLVGICGGVPRTLNGEEIILGDVIISQHIVQYDFGSQYPDGFKPKVNVIGGTDKNINSLMAALNTDLHRSQLQTKTAIALHRLQRRATIKEQRDGYKYRYPGSMHDQLFAPKHRHKHYLSQECLCHYYKNRYDRVCETVVHEHCRDLGCDKEENKEHIIIRERLRSKQEWEERNDEKAQEPVFYFGAIASGKTVMKSGEDRDEVAGRESTGTKGIIAFEMEGAGVWSVLPCIVVKGVCDYADSHKNKIWQDFAAATAAAVTRGILEIYPKRDEKK
ncbi:hypothetical protein Trisim1_002242 [Trichoderma cf. simile WF8]